jgi:protein gp37
LDHLWRRASADPRFTDPDWARVLRDQCAAARVPFFFLQMDGTKKIPYDLFVREFPKPVDLLGDE